MSILKRIMDRRKDITCSSEYLQDTLVLLEALAVESSGKYSSGPHKMERALETAAEYIAEHNLPINFVPEWEVE